MFKIVSKIILHLTPGLTFFLTENLIWTVVNVLFILLLYIKVKKIETKVRDIGTKDRASLKKNLRFGEALLFRVHEGSLVGLICVFHKTSHSHWSNTFWYRSNVSCSL